MKALTCIVCPIGCSLAVEEGPPGTDGFPELTVTGNRCPRGAVYAGEEIRAPRRVVTATCGVRADSAAGLDAAGGREIPRRLPVKTSVPCPREKIPALLADIYRTEAALPVKLGDTVLSDWQGSGINVIAVRTLP
jgi:CxxC motif-containing protein